MQAQRLSLLTGEVVEQNKKKPLRDDYINLPGRGRCLLENTSGGLKAGIFNSTSEGMYYFYVQTASGKYIRNKEPWDKGRMYEAFKMFDYYLPKVGRHQIWRNTSFDTLLELNPVDDGGVYQQEDEGDSVYEFRIPNTVELVKTKSN